MVANCFSEDHNEVKYHESKIRIRRRQVAATVQVPLHDGARSDPNAFLMPTGATVLLLFPAISVGLVERQDARKYLIEHLALPRLHWRLADLVREPVHVLCPLSCQCVRVALRPPGLLHQLVMAPHGRHHVLLAWHVARPDSTAATHLASCSSSWKTMVLTGRPTNDRFGAYFGGKTCLYSGPTRLSSTVSPSRSRNGKW
uniref:Uncharacterized protein n=1 Tax=Zea mays TaxID=4577 RepID=C0PNU2_MAIZE|nr:unknown [Zea mays]